MNIQPIISNNYSNRKNEQSFKAVYPVYHWHKVDSGYFTALNMNDVKKYQKMLTRLLNQLKPNNKEQGDNSIMQQIVNYVAEKDKDYKKCPIVRSYYNYNGGIKNDWRGEICKIEPMVYIITGQDAVDFENNYGKAIGYARQQINNPETERQGKCALHNANMDYSYGGQAFVKEKNGKFIDAESKEPLELHTIIVKDAKGKKDSLLKVGIFSINEERNPFVKKGIKR